MDGKLILPTNWDPALLKRIAPFKPAYIYGSLTTEPTLRSSVVLPEVTEREIASHIQQAKERGTQFVYVMNATCLGNKEFSEEGRWELLQRLEWLREVGAAAVVTANPYIMELLKENFPDLEMQVSVLACVNDPRKARFFRDLGASVIHLDPQMNRDFRRLKAVRQAVDCRLSVVVNEGCLFSCPIREYHANMISHSLESIRDRYYVDYCYYKCSLKRGTDPAEYLRSPWIRPEDLEVYQAMGIDYFKIAGREKMGGGPSSHTQWVAKAAAAYYSRRCEDVAELLVGIQAVEALFGQTAQAPRVQIDSSKLAGFLRFFQQDSCHWECSQCNYCAEWANHAVRVEGDPTPYVRQLESDLQRIRLGSYWTGTR